ncbi:pentatricopeptide repeat-containing protein At1g08070, chloroplastic-like [Ananas comosus]|uniref:Pentatricopeptide repeat-containing protein At1g08070, chloroplastic-like n=1 Tax=Ananas comosus TaxID=4615 RepID=A0A6P5FVH5_ANACO|nr:pentatricopeptide repeat-containing protein At1g08070, chloroplastic-like [Ananas comosus]
MVSVPPGELTPSIHHAPTSPYSSSNHAPTTTTLAPRSTTPSSITDRPSLIRRLSRSGDHHGALALFRDHRRRIKPCDRSISVVLRSCAALRAVRSGEEAHAFALRHSAFGVITRRTVTSLVSFYAHCGLLSHARNLFDKMPHRDVVAWTAMLMAYSDKYDQIDETGLLFIEMLCSGVDPNPHTLTVMLRSATLRFGKQLHCYVMKRSWGSDLFIGSSLIDIYAQNAILDDAHLVFSTIEHKDVVCFNCLISGYSRIGSLDALFYLFDEMRVSGFEPNQSTLVSFLNGCATSGFIGPSMQFHAQAVVRGFVSDEMVQGVIVDMYAKCGDLNAARLTFDRISSATNTVIWNSMICGYGKHGRTNEALRIFESMDFARVRPDYITFICLLSACSHSGLIEEGWRLFNLMIEVHKIAPRSEHLCCMVDLLGRAGLVFEAFEFMHKFKCEPTPSMWGALLSASRACGNVEIAEIASEKLFELERECSASYIVMSSIYAGNGRWDEADEVRELMDDKMVRKEAGCSLIEVGGIVHKFRAGENIGDDKLEVYMMCHKLNLCISDQFDPDFACDLKSFSA